MTVRVDEDLLVQLKQAAQHEDRSLSAYVVRVLRQHVADQTAQARPGKATKGVMGSLRHLGAPDTLDEFRAARGAMSDGVEQGLARTIELLDQK